ncbi:hypothetical protein MMC31_002250 [Peltigera leucophlebia]|nr:hypothetical protein [Peltigera leucophlebia]
MAEYPFQHGGRYRFHTKGQQKSVALTTGKNVLVVPTDRDSAKQIWTAIRNDEAHEIRFQNREKPHPFLEKDDGDDKLKAQSVQSGNFQNIHATTFKTGWGLNLVIDNEWNAIGVKSDGKLEWLSLVQEPSTIFDIEHIEI